MKENRTRVVSNERAGGNAFRMRFAVDWAGFDHGQFVMLEVPGGEVFLRRPFGIVRLEGGQAEILYKVVGPGTRALSRLPVGTELSATGPCGRGYRIPAKDCTAVLVAGGYGIAPLFGLAETLARQGRRAIVYYGAGSKEDLLCTEEIKALGVALAVATEDGSEGYRGTIADKLRKDIGAMDGPELMGCGPEGLMRELARVGVEYGAPVQVSMEAYMACGIGVCTGCACKDKDGNFVRVCREGPVFDAKDLSWS